MLSVNALYQDDFYRMGRAKLSMKPSIREKVRALWQKVVLLFTMLKNYITFTFTTQHPEKNFNRFKFLDNDDVDHFSRYFNKFPHSAYILASSHADIENHLSTFERGGQFYHTLLLSFITEANHLSFKNLPIQKQFAALKKAIPAEKSLLVLPIAVNNRHWTSIHIHLEKKQIYFLDPLGKGYHKENFQNQKIDYYKLTWKLLENITFIMNTLYAQEKRIFKVYKMKSEGPASVINTIDQFDGWNCGTFLFHYALRAGINSDNPCFFPYHNQMGFFKTQISINQLKKTIIKYLNT